MNDTTPKKTTVRVCNEASCVGRGSVEIMKKIEEAGTDYDLDYCPCVGCCEFGPNLKVNDSLVLGVKEGTVIEQIQEAVAATPQTAEEKMAHLDRIIEDLF